MNAPALPLDFLYKFFFDHHNKYAPSIKTVFNDLIFVDLVAVRFSGEKSCNMNNVVSSIRLDSTALE